ncbi:MAG: hypothetical protein KDB14_17105 [Planctomycetales bacterium]|nr:hypothetical protein [Planctomycetales bacterium]
MEIAELPLRVLSCSESTARLVEVLQATHVNGGAVCVSLEPADASAWETLEFSDLPTLEQLLQLACHPAMRDAAPDLQIPERVECTEDWQLTNPLAMEGDLAYQLLMGGAYDSFEGGLEEARSLARAFIDSLLDDRVLQASAAWCHAPWTPWFADVAWDTTYLIRDMEARRFTLLAITDSD